MDNSAFNLGMIPWAQAPTDRRGFCGTVYSGFDLGCHRCMSSPGGPRSYNEGKQQLSGI